MEKQDVLIVTIAIIAFAIVALVVMPMVSGRPAGLPGGVTASPSPTPVAPKTTVPSPAGTQQTTAIPTPTGTPWNGSVKQVGFVGQPEGQATLPPNPTIPQEPVHGGTLVTYAVISGQWSGTTENLYIPTPYWVMEYTAEPMALPPSAYPVLIIQVIDAHNPNRVVVQPIVQRIYDDPPEDPWSVKMFEGNRRYYFKIDTSFLRSYTITIRVPQEYL